MEKLVPRAVAEYITKLKIYAEDEEPGTPEPPWRVKRRGRKGNWKPSGEESGDGEQVCTRLRLASGAEGQHNG